MNSAPPVTNVFIATSNRGEGSAPQLVERGSAGRTFEGVKVCVEIPTERWKSS